MGQVFGGDTFMVGDINGNIPIVKRGRRTTAKTGITTTETGVLRVDDVPVKAGKLYMIMVTNANVDVSVAGDVCQVPIRVKFGTTAGGQATITDTQIASLRAYQGNATDSTKLPGICFYPASTDGFLSVLLSMFRSQGTGTEQVFCSGTDILDMVIFGLGDDPGDTGVVL